MNLYLVGYRGSGKTTVAPRVARALDWPWLDADQELQRAAGATIADIFRDEGEAGFRDRETETLRRLAGLQRHVIALGGGAVLREENRRLLAATGRVAWLRAAPAALAARLAADPATAAQRPRLTAAGGLAEIEQLLAQREPLYQACATWTVDTDHRPPDDLAAEIVAHVRALAT